MPQRNTQQRDMLRSNFAARTAGLHSGTRVHTDVLRSTIAPGNTLDPNHMPHSPRQYEVVRVIAIRDDRFARAQVFYERTLQ